MLDNIWLIPLTTFLSFWLILFFGKRLPRKGSEIGVVALGLTLGMATVAVFQWQAVTPEEAHAPKLESAAALKAHEDGGSYGYAPGTGATYIPKDASASEHEAGKDTGSHGDAGDTGTAYILRDAEEDTDGSGHGTPSGTEAPPHATNEHSAETSGEHEVEKARPTVVHSTTWFTSGDIKIKVGTLVDGLTVVLLFVVALISFLVHVFSTNYMHDDKRYTHYFAALSLFTTGMFVLVTSKYTLQMLFGWELMGLCSFMLIGHWWEDNKNSSAALKAFFTTRTGDVGLLVGISILFFAAGQTFDIPTTNALALEGSISEGLLLAAAIALFIAAIGKSAQFPLHTWLPDAMAGPTPVSALIHAATMVVAGVFLVARMYGVFFKGFDIGGSSINPIAVIGAITILIAAALAFVQSDIKKVLAYSTVSQLGYMIMALGVGGWTAGIFHLFTHAFFKALLFLGAGSVSHAVHSFDMKQDMGGLRKHMPVTFWTFMVGTGALAGLFPLAGFWSKDEILLSAHENGYEMFMWVGLIGAAMTAGYMTRCVYLTFFGNYRGNGHPHESPKAIRLPLVVLALFSIGAGFFNAEAFGIEAFADFVQPDVLGATVAHHDFSGTVALFGTVAALMGIGVTYLYYWRNLGPRNVLDRSALARGGYRFLENRYYLDTIYTTGIVGSIKGPIARATYWVNQNVIDNVLNGTATLMKLLSRFVYGVLDQGIVDGAVNGAGRTASFSGGALRRLQTGRVQQYAVFLFAAAASFGLFAIFNFN